MNRGGDISVILTCVAVYPGSQISQGITKKKNAIPRDSRKKTLGFSGFHEKRAKKSWDSLGDSKKQLVRIPEKKLSFFWDSRKFYRDYIIFFGITEKNMVKVAQDSKIWSDYKT